MGKDSAVMQNTNYKLLDLMKFICAFLVIGMWQAATVTWAT